jgi:hypothetical protein
MKELLNIATRLASGEEVVRAILVKCSRKGAPDGSQGVPHKTTDKGTKRGTKTDKRGLKWRPQQVAVTTRYDEGDNDKDVGDSNEELVATAEHDFKRQAQQPADHFEKLL